MPDPQKFLINTDYPMDMAIATFEETVNIASAGGSATISHGLPFIPLIGGLWSDDNFATAQNFLARQDYMASEVLRREVTVSADSTNITITSDTAGNIQCKIYAYAPPEFTGAIPGFTQVPSTAGFRLNSDYNYMKTIYFGKQMVEHNETKTYPHSLGYVPVVDVWAIYTSDDTTSGPIARVAPYDQLKMLSFGKIKVTDTEVILLSSTWAGNNPPNGYYLRIYHDAA